MRPGLQRIPGLEELSSAYELLLHQKPTPPSVSEVALFSQWARLDPRLAQIWVSFITNEWRHIHPIELHTALAKQPWPSAAGALLEFTERQVALKDDQPNLYRRWKEAVLHGFARAPWQQFYIGLRKIAGSPMLEDTTYALKEYRKWGYLAREKLVPIKQLGPPSSRPFTLDKGTRMEILKSLAQAELRINVRRYMREIGPCISKRQAERDLTSAPFLRAIGNTKGRVYCLKQYGCKRRTG